MAQSGFTPISLYYSSTGAAVPSAGNLVAGELALNTNDGKLYYKNSSGVVTLLAGATSGPAGGSTTQVQYNNAGVLAGITGATTNGTALTLTAPVLGTPASGTVTNLTGTASININGTVGATTPAAGAFTTLSATGTATLGTGLASYALGGGSAASAGLTDKDVTLRAWSVTSGTNEYSGDLILQSGVGTGNTSGKEGSVIIKAGNQGVSAPTLGALTTIGTFSSTGLAVTGTLSATGGKLTVKYNTTTLSDGSEFSNEAGTVKAVITPINAGSRVGIQTYLSSVASGNLTLQEGGGNLLVGTTSNANNDKLVVNGQVYQFQTANGSSASPVTNGGYLFGPDSATVYAGIRFVNQILSNNNIAMAFYTTSNAGSATEAGRFDGSGNLGIGVTSPACILDISGAAGGQIKFPATQNASTDANTLDDYEEGTWTPNSGGTATYSSQNGTYTKVGNKVTVHFSFQVSVIGTGSANSILGLPFAASASAGSQSGHISYATGLTNNQIFIGGYVPASGTTFITTSSGAAASSITTNNIIGNGTLLIGDITYFV